MSIFVLKHASKQFLQYEKFGKGGHHPDDPSGKRTDAWNDLTEDLPDDFDVSKP